MPTYTYACEPCGQTAEAFRLVEDRNRDRPRCPKCHRRMAKDFLPRGRAFEARTDGTKYPHVSRALGCADPEGQKQTKELLARHGIPCHFNDRGCMVIESQTHHRRVLRALPAPDGSRFADLGRYA